MRYDDGRTPVAEWCECHRPELGRLLLVHEQLDDGTFITHHDVFGNHLPKDELDRLRQVGRGSR